MQLCMVLKMCIRDRFMDVKPEDIDFDGLVGTTKDGTKKMSVQELAPKLLVGTTSCLLYTSGNKILHLLIHRHLY